MNGAHGDMKNQNSVRKKTKSWLESRLNHRYKLILLQQYPPWCRWDTLPFFLCYILFIVVDSSPTIQNILLHSAFMNSVYVQHLILSLIPLLFPFTLFIHLSLFFGSQWNIRLMKFVGYFEPSASVGNAPCCYFCESRWTHCLVIPPSTAAIEIVPLKKRLENNNQQGVCIVEYEDVTFRSSCQCKDHVDSYYTGKDTTMDSIWRRQESMLTVSPFPSNGSMGTDAGANQESENHSAVMKNVKLHTLHFPVDLPISFYTKSWLGHDTTDSLTTTEVIYKNNSMPIHLPSLLSILLEQLLQPFFVFQLFCVILWSLDEYWYYAVFTLFSLVIFETTMAFTRLKNLQRLRETLPPPFPVWVYRKRNWVIVMSDCLVPGDIMSLTSRDQIQSNGRHYFPAKLMAAPSRTTEEHHVDGGRYVPADVLLLHGNALVNEASLTGECEPQRKEAISCDDDVLDIEQEYFKRSIVFGGTILLSTDNQSSVDQNTRFSQPPDGGCVFCVLRTGFDSLQGALLRTMVHSTSKSRGDSLHNTSDTFVFILLLLLCALGSSLLVLLAGWNDPTRNKFKLLLHVIIILTSVVPPELPMELSLAVTHSLTDLIRRCKVYCTEPFRIPLAGMVTTCCFDKTGTLTSDDMRFLGVVLRENMDELPFAESPCLVQKILDLPLEVQNVAVACHSLSVIEGKPAELVGDPMEKAVFKASGWTMPNDKTITPPARSLRPAVIIKHRFAFNSKLRRMSVLVNTAGSHKIYTKGAPETVKHLLHEDSIPLQYDTFYRQQMRLGRRVLAMASRDVGSLDLPYGDISKSRNTLENQLQFVGFLVFDSPLKADSTKVVQHLRKAGLEIIMITGDSLLTAVEVARRVGLVKKHHTVYELCDLNRGETLGASLGLIPIHRTDGRPSDLSIPASSIHSLVDCTVCATGDVIDSLNEIDRSSMVPHIKIFARHAPRQKEAVIDVLNASGRVTLMCGDGTNDVGALKRAAIGISIVSVPEAESRQRDVKEQSVVKDNPKKKNAAHLQKLLLEVDDEISQVSLGFASVASPFTARTTSIKCVEDILLRGRCTIASMYQIYKILGINCLINAYQLTVLHLLGVKSGDHQLTASGVVVAVLFLLVSKGEPLEIFSGAERPPSSVLSTKILLSIMFQFLFHSCSITLVALVSQRYMDPYDSTSTSDGGFNANILNTSTYLVSLAATVSTFWINYKGRPYMKALKENKLLFRSLQVSYIFIAALVIEVLPPLNELLQLVPLPSRTVETTRPLIMHKPLQEVENHIISWIDTCGFKVFLSVTICIDCFLAYILDKWITG